MAETKTYAQQQTIKYTKKLNELLKILPSFCTEYFNSLEYSKQPRTRVAYAMDIKGFFEFLICEYPQYANYTVKDFTLADLEKLKGQDISDYLRYVKLYDKEGKEVSNSERAAKRKLCALRRFYAYYYRYEMIGENPTLKVDMPKIHDKAITRLDVNEVAEFLDNVESGNKLSKAQLKRHEKLKTRDLALLTLMLGTGIRVSECVGLDINDVDFDNCCIKIRRKGGYSMSDCLFCKIAEGQIPSNKVYEDEVCYAFYDIDPQAPTHFLVIPKMHIASVAEVTEDNAAVVAHMFAVISKVTKELGLESYRVVSNIGEQAGQCVPHLHFHVLSGRDMTWPPG